MPFVFVWTNRQNFEQKASGAVFLPRFDGKCTTTHLAMGRCASILTAKDLQQETCSNGRADNTGNIGAHGVH